jgi:large repetitive protein
MARGNFKNKVKNLTKPNLRNRRGLCMTRIAAIGAALALAVAGLTAAPAVASASSKDPATITLASSVPTGLVTGEAVFFTATVTASPGPATGEIVFSVVGSNGRVVATCAGGDTQPVSTSGGITTATCSFGTGGLESKPLYYTVRASLSDPNYKAAAASLVQSVDSSQTRTTIAGLPTSLVGGQLFSFTATVHAVAPGAGSPQGSMEFAVCLYSSHQCTGSPSGVDTLPAPTEGDAALNKNQITFTFPGGLLPGFYAVSAQYVGNRNYLPSESDFTYVQVNTVPTTLHVVPSANPTYNEGDEVLTAVINAQSASTANLPAPSGTVTFTITGAIGDTLVCQETGTDVIEVSTNPTNQAAAQCTISGDIMASDSPYSITAQYSGDPVYEGSSANKSVSVINPP